MSIFPTGHLSDIPMICQTKNQTIISLYLELQRMGVNEVLDHKFLVRGTHSWKMTATSCKLRREKFSTNSIT